MEILNSFGFANIFSTIVMILLLVVIYGIYKGFSTGVLWDLMARKLVKETSKMHTDIEDEGVDARLDVNPKISKLLIKMLYELGADRTAILEMHNGKENPSGLPFLYLDMTYEETRDGVMPISDECDNLNLSKFPISSYIYKNRFFIGNIEELKIIDKRIAHRLGDNEIKYIGLIMIRSGKDIGMLEVLYNSNPTISDDEIHGKLGDYVQEIGQLLDLTKHIEKSNEKNGNNKKVFRLPRFIL